MIRRPGHFWLLYLAWAIVCASLFFALRGREDPSRPTGRILSIEAGARASAVLREIDRERYGAYSVVHVAGARRGEGAAEDRWVVLLDRQPRTRLREAVVVELATEDGRTLRVRGVGGSGIAD
ncbi:MAG TPA: hypothetical protein VF701_13335 [Thermoanaerobaculia bacterium]